MTRMLKTLGIAAVSAMALTMAAGPAMATDGMFSNGFGARHKALAGSGVADGNDATSASLNPAGIVHIERDEFSMSVSGFSPRRKYSSTAGGIAGSAFFPSAAGEFDSDKNYFAIPNLAYAAHVGNGFTVAFTVVGNGGMNTQYPATAGGAGGVFGGGFVPGGSAQAGINLEQALISVAVAKEFDHFSIGVAPIIARQVFRGTGFDLFAAAGFCGPNGKCVDKGNAVSWGAGLRAGIEAEVAEGIRIGVAGSTPIWMGRFGDYDGFFAERGSLDIPATAQVGVAIDVTHHLTVMADFKYIWYSQVNSIANPTSNIIACAGGAVESCFGGLNGPGFGWKDMSIIKLGVEFDATHDLTLRAGYSYNTAQIPSEDVTLNILAPGVVQHHFTAGLEFDIDDHWSLEMAAMYAPEESVTGRDVFAPLNPAAGFQTISMYQYEITAGIKYKFGHEEEDDE